MKRLFKRLALIGVAASEILILSGCATGVFSQNLMDDCSEYDPPVEKYLSAYKTGNSLILDYTVNNQENEERYWAELKFGKLEKKNAWLKRNIYEVHRHPLSTSKRNKRVEIPITDISNQIPIGRQDSYKAIHAYIREQPEEGLPQVFICTHSHYHLSIQHRESVYGRIKIYHKEPQGRFIPISKFPKLVVYYPFAVLGDIATFPLLYCASRIWDF